jgi:hypothetical protein
MLSGKAFTKLTAERTSVVSLSDTHGCKSGGTPEYAGPLRLKSETLCPNHVRSGQVIAAAPKKFEKHDR